MAQVHKLNVDIYAIVREKEHAIGRQFEKEDELWFLKEKYKTLMGTHFTEVVTPVVLEKYPELEEKAKNGDIIEDNTSGYRCEGVYFITVTVDKKVEIIRKNTDLDAYGNLPECFCPFVDFEYDHWHVSNLKAVEYDNGTDIRFYYHTEGMKAPFAFMSDNELIQCSEWAKLNTTEGILKFDNRFYLLETIPECPFNDKVPAAVSLEDVKELFTSENHPAKKRKV